MCGIVGLWNLGNEAVLKEMADSIVHRGPDGMGTQFFSDIGLGLGHTRLSIIDTDPRGNQPLVDVNSKAWIVFNGEIYNYKDIKKDLQASGVKFKTSTDTEVLLNAYLLWGESFLSKLSGIFSFAIWDIEKKKLMLARDEFGIKPLYYYDSGNGLAFSSELKSLLPFSENYHLDTASFARYLTYLWNPSPGTPFKEVKKLLPGHYMIYQHGKKVKEERYFKLPSSKQSASWSPDKEHLDELDAHLEEAVKSQLVADVEVGSFLSGGLDSTSVCHYGQKNYDRELRCFTIGYDEKLAKREGMAQDYPFAKKAAEHLNVPLETVWVGSEILDDLKKMVYHLDEPQGDLAPLNLLYISRLAKEKGVKVLLSGAGGDDIFTGYRRHFSLQQEKWWSWSPQSLRKGLSGVTNLFPKNHPHTRRIAKAFKYAHLDEGKRLLSYFFWAAPKDILNLFHDDIKSELTEEIIMNPMLQALEEEQSSSDPIHKMLFLEQKYFLTDHNLSYTDKLSMATGVEVRVPLLDKKLVDYVHTIPTEYKQSGIEGKWVFKKVMERHLPKDIIYRPKTGFGVPLRSWLQNELKPFVDDALSEEKLKKTGIFNPVKVRGLLEVDRANRGDYSYTILTLLNIQIWMDLFHNTKRANL